ncbi:MAG: nucleotidyltransferase domain-containing protein [Zetaproteobacteria bacterium]|nr:nucleotidyltransferase domain-containing protein [Zetaproteobacteria bacterium]MDQ7002349.1 nucleotidyltransferase domain-containing protein [Ghiorsea sp.]
MLLDEIQQRKEAVQTLCQQYGAKHIRVFGSVARREENSDSDIDFIVEFPRGYDLFKQRLPLAEGLQQLLHRNIDLIPEHELNKHLRSAILEEAIRL